MRCTGRQKQLFFEVPSRFFSAIRSFEYGQYGCAHATPLLSSQPFGPISVETSRARGAEAIRHYHPDVIVTGSSLGDIRCGIYAYPTIIVATAFVMCGALAPQQALTRSKKEAQKKEAPKKEAPGKKDAAPKVGPYKPVAIQLPATTTDASFDAFRKQLTGIAQKKDRAALAGLVAASFLVPGREGLRGQG